jgi:hypothetical protein
VNALANPEVGKYINEYFVSAYQKVATFRIVGAQKQGGNVAAYFCAPDGRVLHVVAGPVNAQQMLHEARWVVETTKKAMEHAKNDGAKFKTFFRMAHAEKLRNETGLVVEPVTFDLPGAEDGEAALSYRDPSGRPLAPVLPPPPIVDLDVRLQDRQANAAAAPGAKTMEFNRRGDGKACRVSIGTQGTVHQLMAAHSLAKIEKVYGTVFENILGERISTQPVQVVKPFSWVEQGKATRN